MYYCTYVPCTIDDIKFEIIGFLTALPPSAPFPSFSYPHPGSLLVSVGQVRPILGNGAAEENL